MDDRRVIELQPLPLARVYRRFLNARGARERHDAAYFLFEVLLKYLASIAIAAYLSSNERDHRVNVALKGLARPSLGEWLGFLRECLRFFRERADAPKAVLAVAERLERKEGAATRTVALFNMLRAFLSEKPSQKESTTVAMLFGEVVAFRNRVLGHGAPLEDSHYEKLAGAFAPSFVEILAGAPFLTALRLVAFDSIQVVQSVRVECAVIEQMGSNPMRIPEPLVLPYGAAAPRQGSMYLLGAEGELLLLDPLLLAQGEDIYFLNEAQGSPEYLSYSSGERHRPANLSATQRELFQRILGYEVDEARVSRIGEDLVVSRSEPAAVEGQKLLGDYRVLREIGRGAMGVVFDAVQESLGRRVALKVLPGTFALDPKRVERFRREARATARIHHPSIVPVYEVGEAEGNHFYAMELIDGASLDRVLAEEREAAAKRGRLSRPSAVSPSASDPAAIARRVEHIALLCEGLAAAHALGLVHRDVKPSNVLIDRSGRWVLVDFGLVHEAEAQTLTRSGEMVGTLAYMSPEQASRREADVRSDVYALGVVLYEALTLRAPFDGKSESEIQSAILFEDPPAPRKLNPRVHRDLETVILHAMEKRPERRYASAADLAADLRRFLRYEPIHARPQTRATRFLRRAARHRVRIAGSAAFIVLLSLSGWLWWTSQRPPRYALTPPRQVTFDLTALTTEPCFSPDGKFLSYASDRGGDNLQIWVQSIEGGEARQITFHEADDREPDFSPDGKTIAYRSERDGGGIYLIPASGGAERKLADKGRRPRFSPDGTLVTYWAGEDPQAGQLFIVSSSGGAATRLVPQFPWALGGVWLPDSRHIVFEGLPPQSGTVFSVEASGLWVTPIDGSQSARAGAIELIPRVLVLQKGLVLASDLVWGAETCSLWAIPFGLTSRTVTGPPQKLTAGTGDASFPSVLGDRLSFASRTTSTNLWSLPLQANDAKITGSISRLTAFAAEAESPCLSQDGRRVVYTTSRSGSREVWIKDLGTQTDAKLTSSRSDFEYMPVFSRDGQKIAWTEFQEDRSDVYAVDTNGTYPRKICDNGTAYDWSSDGKGLLLTYPIESEWGALYVDLGSGEKTPILKNPQGSVFQTRFSFDDHWIVFNAVGGTGSRVFVARFVSGRAIETADWIAVSDGLGWEDKPRWSPDGNLVYFVSTRDGSWCIYASRLDPSTKHPATDRLIDVQHFHSGRLSPRNVHVQEFEISVAADKLVLNLGEVTGNIWIAELKEE